jgi:hypothetical protein
MVPELIAHIALPLRVAKALRSNFSPAHIGVSGGRFSRRGSNSLRVNEHGMALAAGAALAAAAQLARVFQRR